jgi:hypothetical protein
MQRFKYERASLKAIETWRVAEFPELNKGLIGFVPAKCDYALSCSYVMEQNYAHSYNGYSIMRKNLKRARLQRTSRPGELATGSQFIGH